MILFVLLLFLSLFCIWQNNSIVISQYHYTSDKLPDSFAGFKILHISDFHNKQFGNNQSQIIKKIAACTPDIIVITGDLIDRRHYDLATAMELARQLVPIAPVYYVPGNHEAWSGHYAEIKEQLLQAKVTVLDNQALTYTIGEDAITIAGLKDPAFLTSDYLEDTNTVALESSLSTLAQNRHFMVLLSHRPELMDLYKKYQIDLVFAGHTHGGQIRLPLVGALIAPNQGLFPKYDAGRYDEEGSTMFVSRGLGNSLVPFRLFNRPELVVVTLKNSP